MGDLVRRKRRFAFGLSLTSLPILAWIAVPVAVFVKLATLARVDERLVEAYSFTGGAILQLVAIYFLEKTRQKPRDRLSVCAVVTGTFSVLAVIVFFGAASAVLLRGW